MKRIKTLITVLCCLLCCMTMAQSSTDDRIVKSVELRNYTLLPGMRDKFSSYMDRIIIPKQRELGGYLMNAFSLNEANDHYVWIRGFADMQSRSKFMKDFYYSDYWRKNAAECNSMLLDSYEVHLLKPLLIKGQSIDTTSGIAIRELNKPTGLTVVTHYVTNNQREKLIALLVKDYLPILAKSGITPVAFFISESGVNDYLPQHVYQDKNLLIMVTHFKDEQEYHARWTLLNVLVNDALSKKFENILVSSESQVLYPLKH